jgi:hypothetical protein
MTHSVVHSKNMVMVYKDGHYLATNKSSVVGVAERDQHCPYKRLVSLSGTADRLMSSRLDCRWYNSSSLARCFLVRYQQISTVDVMGQFPVSILAFATWLTNVKEAVLAADMYQ